ncbi:hypothetical protein V5F34_15350 [Xanthobacter autotrophicus]|uniref:hypothetical protein n=1 Tax=Xanthobacter autotrophicus TaxID=280 RepID=UPI00372B03A8
MTEFDRDAVARFLEKLVRARLFGWCIGAPGSDAVKQNEMLTAKVEEVCALQPTLDRGAFPEDLPSWLSRMARADGSIVPEEHTAYRAILTTLRRLVEARAGGT